MKKLTPLLLACLLFSGCALFKSGSTEAEKAADVQRLSYAAASMGTQMALLQNPAWRVQFTVAYDNLNALVESKVLTGAQLRSIIAALPVKELKSPEARIAIETATMLYDASVGDSVNIERNVYVLAAATGIRNGMKAALDVK